ncbi:unnamed protein product, partial [Enterobius vermicularis]|uniref:Serine/threonine-protein kinase n=1 Tax=Enterobius vermicularis TaxID=51028 RepID=A0A0N4VDG8_ENTVE
MKCNVYRQSIGECRLTLRRNNDYWYDGENNSYNCAGFVPSNREIQRLNHSVDSSCCSLKPIISLPTNPPKSAPPTGGGPTPVDNIENQPSSSGVNDVEVVAATVATVEHNKTAEGRCETSESTEILSESPKDGDESNDLINNRPTDLNFTDAKSATCESDESEYRRFKSEGSTVGVFSVPAPEMEVSIDDFSPILDHKMALPNRITLEQPK